MSDTTTKKRSSKSPSIWRQLTEYFYPQKGASIEDIIEAHLACSVILSKLEKYRKKNEEIDRLFYETQKIVRDKTKHSPGYWAVAGDMQASKVLKLNVKPLTLPVWVRKK